MPTDNNAGRILKSLNYTEFLRKSLREYSRRILANRAELLRLNIERKALKMELRELSKHPILSLYAIMARKRLDDNLTLMEKLAKEQKQIKEYHSVYSSLLCSRLPRE